jgi:hypothetical protein
MPNAWDLIRLYGAACISPRSAFSIRESRGGAIVAQAGLWAVRTTMENACGANMNEDLCGIVTNHMGFRTCDSLRSVVSKTSCI